MSSNKLTLLAFVVSFGLGTLAAAASETDPDFCRDYVPVAGAGCLYPTEPARIGTVLVCRCPHSRDCAEAAP